jgi:hypothetical protein
MPSDQTKWYKDVRLIEALDVLRKRNLDFMAKCYFCGKKSQGIKAIGYQLFAVCPNHESGVTTDINGLLESQTSFEE